MNIALRRRPSWIAAIVTIALAVGVAPMLRAQDSSDERSAAPADGGGELKTVAVIAGARYDKLVTDIAFLGSLAGRPEIGQMVEGGMAFLTHGKGPTAIDKTQPWGVIVQTDGAAFLSVGCLPMLKPDDLLTVAKGYGADIKDGGNGTKHITLPNQRSFFVKHENGVSFIGISADSLARLPENPQAILGKLVGDYDVVADISMKNVPEMYRQFALQAMQSGVQQGLVKKDDESDEQFEARQKMAEAQMAQMTQMINDIESLKMGWAVDSKKERTYLDFAYQFLPGSKMARQMSAYGDPKTNFAGFQQPDAAATVSFATQADPKLIADDLTQFESTLQTTREQLNKSIDGNEKIEDAEVREALKAAVGDLFDALEATVKSGQFDGGASLRLGPDSLTLVAGVKVAEPAKLESALKKLETAAQKSPEFPGIKWNAADHAGVKFHTITVPVPEGEEAPRKLLGSEVEVAIGLGPDAAYLALGRDNLEAVTKAIDASASNKGKSVPPFEVVVSLTPIMEVAAAQADEGDQKEIAAAIAETLRNDGAGADHIRAMGKIVPNGLRYRLEVEGGVLRAVGKAAAAAQQKALEAQQAQQAQQ